ncbi:14960_t:CDS:2 [Racocetra fulgida]|uniref:14960_t:CDS:1 n=1 Tax=Racocetra fulgida TaxID=60492 RepID=A0A9N8YX96_9GLOM|nr:14960_t:CDS:2 [Racocetra fulgida]
MILNLIPLLLVAVAAYYLYKKFIAERLDSPQNNPTAKDKADKAKEKLEQKESKLQELKDIETNLADLKVVDKGGIIALTTYFTAKKGIEAFGSTPANRAEQLGIPKERLPEHRQKYLDNRKEYLNERQETHKKELDELYKKVEKLQEEKTQVAAQINETNDSQEKAKLQAQLASLENQLKDVKGQISKKEKQIANDEKAIDDLFKEISNDTSLTPEQVQKLETKRKMEETQAEIRKLELQNQKEINEKNQETLLEIERIRAEAKKVNQEKVKRMIEENNKQIVESIGEKTSKLEEQQVQIAADLKDARQKGDKRAEQIALKAMAEVNKKLGLVKGVATNLITGKDIDELAQTTDQP